MRRQGRLYMARRYPFYFPRILTLLRRAIYDATEARYAESGLHAISLQALRAWDGRCRGFLAERLEAVKLRGGGDAVSTRRFIITTPTAKRRR